uniref:Uncharacterized protein n=1 Tax=Moumouvirus sp. 'Monve' TaxID=1128131 RepID=H2ED75_9VIRU|nr:hypothetical protein mv_L143 [Moumouvirus Monve]
MEKIYTKTNIIMEYIYKISQGFIIL